MNDLSVDLLITNDMPESSVWACLKLKLHKVSNLSI